MVRALTIAGGGVRRHLAASAVDSTISVLSPWLFKKPRTSVRGVCHIISQEKIIFRGIKESELNSLMIGLKTD